MMYLLKYKLFRQQFSFHSLLIWEELQIFQLPFSHLELAILKGEERKEDVLYQNLL